MKRLKPGPSWKVAAGSLLGFAAGYVAMVLVLATVLWLALGAVHEMSPFVVTFAPPWWQCVTLAVCLRAGVTMLRDAP